jgi:integrase
MDAVAGRRARRSPGEGGTYPYQTRGGQRWRFVCVVTLPDGSTRRLDRRGYTTRKDALKAMREALAASDRRTWTDPSKQPLAAYLTDWAAGLRLAPSTVASYRKNLRLHVIPHLGQVPLASVTTAQIDALYRKLEDGGRADHKAGAGLSARTVRYVHTILGKALRDAVDADMIQRNPAARTHPPSAKEARSPEMACWTAPQLSAFLAWSEQKSSLHTAWRLLALTGMRRGELLALRWKDVNFTNSTITVRRSVGVIRHAGESVRVDEGPTKNGRARVVNTDSATMASLKAWRSARALLALPLAATSSLVFGDLEGQHRHPERFSRLFSGTLARCQRELGEDVVPLIRLHDLRHTHATLLLATGEPVRLVSERLGHASAVVTMAVYAHVLPGSQAEAASRFAELIAGS